MPLKNHFVFNLDPPLSAVPIAEGECTVLPFFFFFLMAVDTNAFYI